MIDPCLAAASELHRLARATALQEFAQVAVQHAENFSAACQTPDNTGRLLQELQAPIEPPGYLRTDRTAVMLLAIGVFILIVLFIIISCEGAMGTTLRDKVHFRKHDTEDIEQKQKMDEYEMTMLSESPKGMVLEVALERAYEIPSFPIAPRSVEALRPAALVVRTEPIVSFVCTQWNVSSSLKSHKVWVVRLGPTDRKDHARIVGVPGTAKPGQDLVDVDQVINFEHGEHLSIITVNLVDDDLWEPEEYFALRIAECSARFDPYRYCRVTIVDDDCWPMGENISAESEIGKEDEIGTKDQGNQGGSFQSRSHGNMTFDKPKLSFSKRCWNRVVAWVKRMHEDGAESSGEDGDMELMIKFLEAYAADRPRQVEKSLLAKLWRAFHASVVAVLVPRFTIDFIIVECPKSGEYHWIPILAFGFLFSIMLTRCADHMFAENHSAGAVATTLRKQSAFKFASLWRLPESAPQESASDWSEMLIKEVQTILDDGWLNAFSIFESLSKCCLSVICVLVMALSSKDGASFSLIFGALFGPLVMIPTTLVVVNAKRGKSAKRLLMQYQDTTEHMFMMLDWLFHHKDIFRNYRNTNSDGGSRIVDKVTDFTKTYAVDGKKFGDFRADTNWIVRYLEMTMAVGLLLFGALEIIHKREFDRGSLSIGIYVALSKVFDMTCKTLMDLNDSVIRLDRAIVAARRIQRILNCDTGVWTEHVRQVHNSIARYFEIAAFNKVDGLQLTDISPALVNVVHGSKEGVVFHAVTIASSNRRATPIFERLSMNFPMGAVIGIRVGSEPDVVKRLLLTVAGMEPVDDGSVSRPPMLETVLVDAEPSFLLGTVMENLLLHAKAWVTEDIAVAVATAVGLPKRLCIDPSVYTGSELSHVVVQLVSITRALLSDPHMLVVAAFGMHPGQWQARPFSILRQWRERHGLHRLVLDLLGPAAVPLPASVCSVVPPTLVVGLSTAQMEHNLMPVTVMMNVDETRRPMSLFATATGVGCAEDETSLPEDV